MLLLARYGHVIVTAVEMRTHTLSTRKSRAVLGNKMNKSICFAAACGTAFVAATANAQSIECGETYIVSPGDSLSLIAERAYGRGDIFTLIYTANADVIGPNPGRINVGQTLQIPCRNAEITESVADASAVGRPTTTEALPGPAINRPIRVLTGTDWAPFSDEDQEQGGLLTELTNLALAQADGSPEYQIDFINDWGAHLSPLLTDHAYDFSIGWTQPNCELLAELNDDSKFRCNNFNWTDPIYQQIVAYYSLSNVPNYSDHAQISGKTVCRPEGYSTAMLEEVGLAEPDITLVRPADPTGCLNAVLAGDADVALIATDVAEGLIGAIADPSAVKLHEDLSYVSSLRALIAKTHPQSQDLVDTFNSGLIKIKDSGVWFSTVRRHMTEHRNSGA